MNVVDPPRFLRDGRYVWKSERSGYMHLAVGKVGGGEPAPITRGDWLVDKIAGIDEGRGLVYFTATEENVRRRPIYRVALDGTGNKTARIVLVFFKAFFIEEVLFFRDVNSDLVSDVIVAVGN